MGTHRGAQERTLPPFGWVSQGLETDLTTLVFFEFPLPLGLQSSRPCGCGLMAGRQTGIEKRPAPAKNNQDLRKNNQDLRENNQDLRKIRPALGSFSAPFAGVFQPAVTPQNYQQHAGNFNDMEGYAVHRNFDD